MSIHAIFDTPGPRGARRIRILTWLSIALILAVIGFAYYRFYASGALAPSKWLTFTQPPTLRYLGKALLNTLMGAAVAGAAALPLGLLMALGRMSRSRWLRWPSTAVIELLRAIPVLLLIFAFMFALPAYGLNVSTFAKLIIPITLCAAATIAEVFRAGILAVPRGQTEGALAVGLTEGQTFRLVLFPQALRIVVPTLVAQLTIVVKDTAFGYVVSYPELLQSGRVLIANTGDLVQTYLVVTVVYILVNVAISFGARALDRRLARRTGRTRTLTIGARGTGIA